MSHLGIVKMKSIAKATFWWPGLDKEIEDVANSCKFCCKVRPNPEKKLICTAGMFHLKSGKGSTLIFLVEFRIKCIWLLLMLTLSL